MVFELVYAILIIFILIILFLINFYRDPKRKIPKGNNIVSPADGRVISIIGSDDRKIRIKKGLSGKIKTLTKDIAKECYVISIFMSPFDAHINRAPIGGIVKSISYSRGKFYKAFDLEKSLQNEKNEIIIQNKKLRVKVIQIAGFLARRIKCFVKVYEKVNKGGRIGMIVLGSQVTIILPRRNIMLNINKGAKVKAGSSIIGFVKESCIQKPPFRKRKGGFWQKINQLYNLYLYYSIYNG